MIWIACFAVFASDSEAIQGISRKFSITLLEHLDATGLTRRAGDRRIIVAPERTLAQARP